MYKNKSMKEKYLHNKLEELISTGKEPIYESVSLKEFFTEFDYATRYLSRLLKARSLVMYLLLFKIAYLERGKRSISVKVSDISENLLSDLGKPMSNDTVRKGINDLIKNKVISSSSAKKPGQINTYEIKLPSEIQEVRELIKQDTVFIKPADDSKDDYYTDPEKRLKLLKRDNNLCFYCLLKLKEDNFYLDHIIPKTQGGYNYKSNLVSACNTCNTKKNNNDSQAFLLNNYRSNLLTQDEYKVQSDKLQKLTDEYLKINT